MVVTVGTLTSIEMRRQNVDRLTGPSEIDREVCRIQEVCDRALCLRILVVTAMYPHVGNESSGAFVKQQVEQLRALGHAVDVLHFPGYRSRLEYRQSRLRGVSSHSPPALFRCPCSLRVNRIAGPLPERNATRDFAPRQRRAGRMGTSRCSADLPADLRTPRSSLAEKIAERIPGEVIPCGVDLTVFEPKSKTEARRRLKLDLSRKYVLFPFSPTRRIKRFDLASAAVAKLAAEGLDIELLVASKSPNEEMPWYYSAADAMILCSNSEGSPTAVKEALACDLPVVSTDVGDVREIMDGIAGVEIAEQTAGALAGALKRVLYPPPGFVFNGRAAMERYSQMKTVRGDLAGLSPRH